MSVEQLLNEQQRIIDECKVIVNTLPKRLGKSPRTNTILQKHKETFGDVSLSRILAKLLEESGELARAVARYLECREGNWCAEVEKELGDAAIVLYVLAGRFGFDMDQIISDATCKFLLRE